MSLSVGDAVLTFLGDTTQLDQVFARLPAEAEAAMTKAAGGVGIASAATQGLNFELDATAENAAYAGGEISTAATAASGAMDLTKGTVREAKAEIGLLGEAVGVHLPRHVRGFVAELPGVATALSGAFAATAVFFIIQALAEGIAKLVEFAQESEKINIAWIEFDTAVKSSLNSLDEKLLKSGAQVDSLRGDHLAALKKELELINLQSLSQLEGQFGILAKAADAMFAKLQAHWFEMGTGSVGASHALQEFRVEYDLLLAEGKTKEASDLLAGTLKSAKETLATMQSTIKEVEAANKAAAAFAPAGFQVTEHGPSEKELKAQQTLIDALNAQVTAETKIAEIRKDESFIKTTEQHKKAAEEELKLDKEREAGLERRRKAEATYANEQKKQHEKAITDAQALEREEVAASDAVRRIQLHNLQQASDAQKVVIDGEMEHRKAVADLEAEQVKALFDRNLISAKEYEEKIKALYNKEAQDLIQMLNRKQQLVIQDAQREAAQRGKILSDAEAKELKGYIELENQKRAVLDKSLKVITKDVDDATKHAQKAKPTWDKFFDELITGSMRSGAALKMLGRLTAEAIGESVSAAVMGSQSFGEAMQQMLKSALAMLAGKAVVKVLEELAEAFSALANPFTAHLAPGHFKAAGMWGAVAVAAAAAGSAIGGSGSSGSGAGGPQIDTSNPNTQTGKNPGQGEKNVPHLAGGGLITSPTLAMIGDARGGGRATEGVIPLDDPRAMTEIAAAIADRIGRGGANNFYVKGLVSGDTLGKIAKKLSRQVQTGRARLIASNSHRITRRA